jgi:hypothetical protein
MSSIALLRRRPLAERRSLAGVRVLPWRDARFQAYALLRTGFAVAPWVNDLAPGSAQEFMYFVGGVEVLAGLAVALKPRYGAYLVAAWLGGIIVNLLTYSGYYDIALRDFGLLIGALALGRLAAVYDGPRREERR